MNRFAPQHKLAASWKLPAYLEGRTIFPINVEISLVGFCNARCPHCFYAQPKAPLPGWDKEHLSFTLIEKLFSEFDEIGVKAITYTGGGDPSLHPHIDQISKLANSYNIQQGIITNGIKIDYAPDVFEWIRISLTNRPLPVKNFERLRTCKTLGINVNYSGDEEEVKRVLEIAHKYQVDYVEVRPALNLHGKTTEIDPPDISDPLLQIIDYKFSESRKPHGGYKKCQGYHFVPFVWQNGDVDVCAYHYGDPTFNLGNLYREPFAVIMARAPQFVKVNEKCQVCCKNHEINKLINNLQNLQNEYFV